MNRLYRQVVDFTGKIDVTEYKKAEFFLLFLLF